MQNLVLITQVGFSMITPPLLGVYLGSKLDKLFGTGYLFSLILLICGVVAGFMNTYQLLINANKDKNGKW